VATRAVLNYQGGPATIQAGKIVLAGATHNGILVLARYTAAGRLDSTFGEQGFVKITGFHHGATAVVAQNDGKILMAAGNSAFRLEPNGQLDTSFGRRGIVRLGDGLSTLALQADGKVLVGGRDGYESTLTRLAGGNNCAVPDLRGKTVSKARAGLKASYCRSGRISKRFSRKVARGRVIATAPQRGARLPGGSRVGLLVSRGRP
jgi:uncharacterized delta-60 repeat protein